MMLSLRVKWIIFKQLVHVDYLRQQNSKNSTKNTKKTHFKIKRPRRNTC